jgi:hypothetical protein
MSDPENCQLRSDARHDAAAARLDERALPPQAVLTAMQLPMLLPTAPPACFAAAFIAADYHETPPTPDQETSHSHGQSF